MLSGLAALGRLGNIDSEALIWWNFDHDVER
jgi:hypothetical protein